MRKAVEIFVPGMPHMCAGMPESQLVLGCERLDLLLLLCAGAITESEAKRLDTRQEVGEERVVMWNILKQRKVAGNNAPHRAHLLQYLENHPEYEVYTGQNLPDGGLLKSPSNASPSEAPTLKSANSLTPSAEDDARTAWGALEDAKLASLVREHGPGSWVAKASVVSFECAGAAGTGGGAGRHNRRRDAH